MAKKPPEIKVDLGKKCKGCGKGGATQNGYCLECINKSIRRKIMSKKNKDMIQKTYEPHVLPCKLSEKDRAEAADKLATALQRVDSLELEKKAKVAEFKGLIDAQKERIHSLTVEVKDGVAQRPIDCELQLNYSKLSATLIRLDIDEIVEERAMTEEEKQMKFDKKDMQGKVKTEELEFEGER